MKGMTDKPAHDRNGHCNADRPDASYTVKIEGASDGFACRADHTVIQAMHAAGRSDLPYACRGGGCGTCRVTVKAGLYVSLPMSAACISPDQQAAGVVLACRIKPRGNLVLTPASMRGKMGGESRAA